MKYRTPAPPREGSSPPFPQHITISDRVGHAFDVLADASFDAMDQARASESRTWALATLKIKAAASATHEAGEALYAAELAAGQ